MTYEDIQHSLTEIMLFIETTAIIIRSRPTEIELENIKSETKVIIKRLGLLIQALKLLKDDIVDDIKLYNHYANDIKQVTITMAHLVVANSAAQYLEPAKY